MSAVLAPPQSGPEIAERSERFIQQFFGRDANGRLYKLDYSMSLLSNRDKANLQEKFNRIDEINKKAPQYLNAVRWLMIASIVAGVAFAILFPISWIPAVISSSIGAATSIISIVMEWKRSSLIKEEDKLKIEVASVEYHWKQYQKELGRRLGVAVD